MWLGFGASVQREAISAHLACWAETLSSSWRSSGSPERHVMVESLRGMFCVTIASSMASYNTDTLVQGW